MREEYKMVEIQGRTFRIGKYNALSGAFILAKVAALISPIFKKLDLNKLKDANETDLDSVDISSILAEIGNMNEDDFLYVQKRSLQVACEMLPAGPTPVLDKNGNFGVLNMETNVSLALILTVHVVMFNVSSFFDGNPLTSVMGISTTSPQS